MLTRILNTAGVAQMDAIGKKAQTAIGTMHQKQTKGCLFQTVIIKNMFINQNCGEKAYSAGNTGY